MNSTGAEAVTAQGQDLAARLVAELTAFWDSPAAVSPPGGPGCFDLPLARANLDQVADTENPYWEIIRLLPRGPLTGEPDGNPRIAGPSWPGQYQVEAAEAVFVCDPLPR